MWGPDHFAKTEDCGDVTHGVPSGDLRVVPRLVFDASVQIINFQVFGEDL